MMKSSVFVAKAIDIADNYKTSYMLGPWGWPTNDKMITRATTQGSNAAANCGWLSYANAIKNKGFLFDCIGLIKGILWGWSGDLTKSYGGAGYACNSVPDVGADTTISKYCKDVSTNFSNIVPGEAVWMTGHIGIYIGNGVVIESTPRWKWGVQRSTILNVTKKQVAGTVGSRTWTKHGKLVWVDYTGSTASNVPTTPNVSTTPTTGGLKVGDVVNFIGTTHYTTAAATVGVACKPGKATVIGTYPTGKHPYQLKAVAGGGSTVYGWVNTADIQSTTVNDLSVALDKLTKLGVINSPTYWKQAVTNSTVKYVDDLIIKAANKITKAGPRAATAQDGINRLVTAGVIDSPTYWAQNYTKMANLGDLLMALGGSV